MTTSRDAAPVQATAVAAHLHYVTDGEPGLRRETKRGTFLYRDAKGRIIRDAATLERIRAIVIPPAWRDVWICARADGHIQATGRDARGRKQHRYHRAWTSTRNEAKFDQMVDFAQALPAIRKRVRADLKQTPLSRPHVLATVVSLLERTLIRIGNKEYVRANKSFGLTTLLDEHVSIKGTALTFHFRAKSGIMQTIELKDAALAGTVRKCRALPGRTLFQFVDADGRCQCVDSVDVNRYLGEITGRSFTAKNFRTWAASVLAAQAVCDLPACTSDASFKRQVVGAIDRVAARLGNTRAVCRSSYIHPAVLAGYRHGITIKGIRPSARVSLRTEEVALLALLRNGAAESQRAAA